MFLVYLYLIVIVFKSCLLLKEPRRSLHATQKTFSCSLDVQYLTHSETRRFAHTYDMSLIIEI